MRHEPCMGVHTGIRLMACKGIGSSHTCRPSKPLLHASSCPQKIESPGNARHRTVPLMRRGQQKWKQRGLRAVQGSFNEEALQSQSSMDLPSEDSSRISIFYHTAWDRVFLHGSLNGGNWKDYQFRRLSPAGGDLRVVHIAANPKSPQGNGAPLLEFVVHNGTGQYDKAPQAKASVLCLLDRNYMAEQVGGYHLEFGEIRPIKGEAFMLVSDLDDTMFGDDNASKSFKDFWERDARLRGSCLVYNTGRALDKWLSLWREKSWCLAAPDYLITSVGTKVFTADPDNFQGWTLDQGFAKQLDKGWNLEKVREATYKALAAAGKDRMHFRPPDEQNDHKITCGVQSDIVEKIKGLIEGTLKLEGVQAQLITSGRGDWRFLDIVSKRAGKLSALEFVRRHAGFDSTHTIACGDSGNDKDMLSGKHRAIVVGNAEPDLKEWLLTAKKDISGPSTLYIADSHMAQGIMEGVKHFGF